MFFDPVEKQVVLARAGHGRLLLEIGLLSQHAPKRDLSYP